MPGELLHENIIDIFTCDNNMLAPHVKRSPLLWFLFQDYKKILKLNGLVYVLYLKNESRSK